MDNSRTDYRDVEVPSVVASIKDPDKYTAFDTMLEATHFFDTLEAIRTSLQAGEGSVRRARL